MTMADDLFSGGWAAGYAEAADRYQDELAELTDRLQRMEDERDEALATLERVREAVNELLDFAEGETE